MSESPELRSFQVAQDISIGAPPEKVFAALVDDVASWWGSPMLCTENPVDFVMEKEPGGAFYEKTADGEFAVWGRLTAFRENALVEYEGSVGLPHGVHGCVRLEVEKAGEGSLVKLSHSAVGIMREDTVKSYDMGWRDLLGRRFKAFVEEGVALGIRGENK